MSDQTFQCPRRAESPLQPSGEDDWGKDDSCSYCGSLNPITLMERLEIGDVELGPTDKSYKVYVKNRGGALFKQSYKNCPDINDCWKECNNGAIECSHWVTRDVVETKFYFQHLSPEQQKRFIELLNARKIKLGMPGHFYVLPFFMGKKTEELSNG